MAQAQIDLGRYQLGWHDKVDYAFEPKKGLSRAVVEEISALKGEPDWMRRFRLRSLDVFERKPMKPWFADNMPVLDFQDIYYYLKPTDHQVSEWDELPEQMRPPSTLPRRSATSGILPWCAGTLENNLPQRISLVASVIAFDAKCYRSIAKSSLTPFHRQRIFKFRDALSQRAIAVFYFWGRECNFKSSLIRPDASETVN